MVMSILKSVTFCLRIFSLLLCEFWGIRLFYQDILNDEELEIRAVKHVQCIGGRADHRLAALVEGESSSRRHTLRHL